MRKRLARAAALALGLALLAFGAERSVSLRAFVEAVNVERAVLRVDSYDVHVGESGVRGHVRSLEEVQPGLFARVRGEILPDGTVKASSVHIKKANPGVSFRRKLEKASRRAEEEIAKDKNKKMKLVEDEELNAYVGGLGMRLVPEWAGPQINFRFRVLDHPEVNAFAMPGGQIYVFTGLLGRVENEAQLVTILGHEIAHVTERHSERTYKKFYFPSIFLNVTTIFVNPGLSQAESLLIGLALNAAVNGHGRNQEDQSDRVGLRYSTAAGYDPREGPKVWDLFNAVYGDTPKAINFFYGNHSTNKVRKRNQEEEIAWHYRDFSALPIDTGGYQQRMVAWTLKAAEHDFEEGRSKVARKEFERVLRVRPDDETAREYLAKLDKKKETKEAKKKGS
ncbi:MAG: M48 family metallopeptidase [Acidobacteriota bacterium]|nr:MAG: M48 family metallopeptidase [Acidobacteriota bacterium]